MTVALFWVAIALYALASAVYLASLLGLPDRYARHARLVLGLAFIAHMLEIGARGVAGLHPVSSVREAIGFLAWALTGGLSQRGSVRCSAPLMARVSGIGAQPWPVSHTRSHSGRAAM